MAVGDGVAARRVAVAAAGAVARVDVALMPARVDATVTVGEVDAVGTDGVTVAVWITGITGAGTDVAGRAGVGTEGIIPVSGCTTWAAGAG